MKRENLASGSNWVATVGYSQAVRRSLHPSFSPSAMGLAIGLASGMLVLSGWRYLPNLVYASLLSYVTPVPLVFGASTLLARRHPTIAGRLAMLISVSFEAVILFASIVLAAPPTVIVLQLTTGLILVCTAYLAARVGTTLAVKRY